MELVWLYRWIPCWSVLNAYVVPEPFLISPSLSKMTRISFSPSRRERTWQCAQRCGSGAPLELGVQYWVLKNRSILLLSQQQELRGKMCGNEGLAIIIHYCIFPEYLWQCACCQTCKGMCCWQTPVKNLHHRSWILLDQYSLSLLCAASNSVSSYVFGALKIGREYALGRRKRVV